MTIATVERDLLLARIEMHTPQARQLFVCLLPSADHIPVPELNQCIRYLLVKLPINTLGAREWLDDHAPNEVWIDTFIQRILPVFVKAYQQQPHEMTQPLFRPTGVMA